SATSAPPTTKPFTPPQKSRHDQHTRTVREIGSGSVRETGQSPLRGLVATCGCDDVLKDARRAALRRSLSKVRDGRDVYDFVAIFVIQRETLYRGTNVLLPRSDVTPHNDDFVADLA